MKNTIILALAVAVLLPSAAEGALEIIGFSCNDLAPTAHVEAGETLNCAATIKNTDSQNAAGVTSVVLVTSGGWADAESYTGSGFSSSISAGGTTTATFSGIVANVPGDDHKFLHIDIDDAAHTEEVADLTVNAVIFKSLAASPSASSAADGAGFTVNAYLTAGGSVSSASMELALSGGCSLASGESASKSLGSLSDNLQVSTSWSVVQGSSACRLTVDATGTSGPVTVTASASSSVSVTTSSSSSTTSSSSSGGGGGGGGGAGGGGSAAQYLGELAVATPVVASSGAVINFKLAGADHKAMIKAVTPSSATLEVQSDPVTVTFAVGDTIRFDLDTDPSTYDLSITLESINASASTASFTFRPLSEPIPQQPGVVPTGGVCVPNEKACNGASLLTCRPDGLGWITAPCEYDCDPASLACRDPPEGEVPAGPGPVGLSPVVGAVSAAAILIALVVLWLSRRSGRKGRKKVVVLSLLVIAVASLLALGFPLFLTGHASGDPVAACLNAKAVRYYGASWCASCREQLTLLGSQASRLAVVDCATAFDACVARGIKEIPAWEIGGDIVTGVLNLEEVANRAGC